MRSEASPTPMITGVLSSKPRLLTFISYPGKNGGHESRASFERGSQGVLPVLTAAGECGREDGRMASNCDLVRDFIGAWEARDLDGILSRMTPDATYLNVGLSEAKGHEAIRATITPFLQGANAVRWTIMHIAE